MKIFKYIDLKSRYEDNNEFRNFQNRYSSPLFVIPLLLNRTEIKKDRQEIRKTTGSSISEKYKYSMQNRNLIRLTLLNFILLSRRNILSKLILVALTPFLSHIFHPSTDPSFSVKKRQNTSEEEISGIPFSKQIASQLITFDKMVRSTRYRIPVGRWKA